MDDYFGFWCEGFGDLSGLDGNGWSYPQYCISTIRLEDYDVSLGEGYGSGEDYSEGSCSGNGIGDCGDLWGGGGADIVRDVDFELDDYEDIRYK